MVQLGMAGDVLTSRTIWVCASCQTCTTRCPNDIDIAGLMDTLRQTARARGIPCPEPRIAAFHDALLKSIRRHGKVFELEMTLGYKLATGDLMGDAGLGWEMFKRGKLRFFPSRVGDMKGVRKIFDKKED
jgi:heterodisulfide reductase subunit C